MTPMFGEQLVITGSSNGPKVEFWSLDKSRLMVFNAPICDDNDTDADADADSDTDADDGDDGDDGEYDDDDDDDCFNTSHHV